MTRKFKLSDSISRHSEITARPVSAKDLLNRFQPTPSNSMAALVRKMGPFVPQSDAFRFGNSFAFTDVQIAQIQQRLMPFSAVVVGAAVQQIRDILNQLNVNINPFPVGPSVTIGLPDFVVNYVVGVITQDIIGSIVNQVIAGIFFPGNNYGRCGGMAFAAYDFYLLGWTVDERLGTEPPATGVLGDYIFSRLLDSLDSNGATFIDWLVDLAVLPVVSEAANVALGVAIGSIGGPLGAAFGALLGSQINIFHAGGPSDILSRSKNEWQKIKSKLDAEAAWPIGLIYPNDISPFDQHQVLAIGYTDNQDGTGQITIWDNNDSPPDAQGWAIDFRGSELQMNQISGTSREAPKGLFLENYSPQRPPDSLKLQ
jgi:hypothetical protein